MCTTTSGFPEELLARVLIFASECLHEPTCTIYHPQCWPLVLRLVCLDWKFTLDHCPRYWATILAVARDERVWDIILPLAKAVPLKISTAFTVPLERQSLVLARVRVAHIDRDDATTSWDSVLSSFEDLPLLDALHLTRPYSHRRNKKPLTIRASRLWMLCLDRPASIQAVDR